MKKWKILLAVLLVAIIVCAVVIFANLETPQETPQDTTADKTATVTFYNGDKVYETATVEIGAKLTLPKAPKAEKGKGLIGWSTIDGDVEEIIDPATFVVNADIKLYTVWADVYTVTINADNGQPFDVREVFAGTIIEKPADPVKEGFKFVEWRDALQETAFDFSQPIYADVIIKAMYGDGAPNRVSDTKWDFSTGIHGSWIGAQGGWKYQVNGLPAEDMVYQTTEDGYAAWGFTLTDSLDNIPVVDGNNAAGLGMKYIYNEGISVSASKAKLVVIYLKPKYFPMDMATSPNDQFRISVLTSNGGMIYGYGSGSEDWSLRTDAGSKNYIQVDQMEDGWIRVQFKIHKLEVWSEDAVIKGMAISFVQRKATPVMDVISVKSIELLDQEEFIDPHEIEYVTKNDWDMTKEEDSTDWFGVMSAGVDTNSVKTTIDANGTQFVYANTNKWRGMVLNTAKIDISKCSGIFSATIDISGMQPTNYRLYIVTDRGGDLYKNSGRDDVSCYYAVTSATELADGWTVTPNADGTITVYYDLTKLEYWKTGTELQGLSFVTVDGTTNGTVIYKSVSLVDAVNTHNCETDGHLMKDATCTKPKTCSVCGVTQGEAKGHSFKDGTCSVCGVPEFVQNKWDMSDEKDAAGWFGYHAKKKNEALTVTVTEAGLQVAYGGAGNGWKALVLENTAIDISKLTGKLTFTYSSDMDITSYRIHILTDLGGNLTANGTADCYVAVSIGDITAGNLEAWTQTINADGSVTVTFDLSTLNYFTNGTELKGLTIVTVTGNGITGSVTYKSIELEATAGAHDCQADGHIWRNATCTKPKTCSVCGATEGKPAEHNWSDATCTKPKTCSVCGVTEGEANGHNFADGICSVCGVPEFVQNKWDMSDEKDAANWSGYQSKKKNEALTTTVTEAGLQVAYGGAGNGWKALVLENTAIDISKLTGKLTFTYSSDMDITSYRIHILTDLGGNLTANGTADCYVAVSIGDITAGNLEAWTQTINADGSVTVTFDLSTLNYFTNGTELKGLTIVTVTGNGITGSVTYKSIELEATAGAHDCQADGHIWRNATCTKPKTCSVCGATEGKPAEHNWSDATCTKPKTCSVCGVTEGEALGHTWSDATCTKPKTCSVCGATEGTPAAHTWLDATCLKPKTCSACGATEGELGGHADANGDHKCDICETNLCTDHHWNDATCTKPKTCSVCGAVEGDPVDHTWNDATCIKPKTCSACGATEGELGGHADTDKDHVCDVCAGHLVVWYMNNAEDAANWNGYHAKKPNEALTTTVTEAGLGVTYEAPGNGWKGLVLEGAAIDISKLTGKLTFTYSSDMDITSYRIHIQTDLGGKLTANGTADCYVEVSIADIQAGKLDAWTQTTNADGSVTVTFDLSTMGHFKNGTELNGLTIVTVTANKVTGTVTYKSIELETVSEEHDCQADGHAWHAATCTKPKTCAICGATEGEPIAHNWSDATCTKAKTCSVCGATEGEPIAHNWDAATCTKPKTCSVCGATEGEPIAHNWDAATCTKPKTCSVCGATEGEPIAHNWDAATCIKPKTCTACGATEGVLGNHTDANGDYQCDICETNLCTDHTWSDATCTNPRTCSVCGATEGEPLGHTWSDATCTKPKTCSVCGVTEGEPHGHTWSDATCTTPKTCSVCGATEGEALGHTWSDATCTTPKTCSVCGVTEGEPHGHTWSNATCTNPKTCSVCAATEGAPLGHTWSDATCIKRKICSVCATEGELGRHADADKDLVCDVCTDNMAIWVMNHEADAADWNGYHAKKKNEALTTTVTGAGLEVAYASPGNGWKALVLEGTAINISKLTGKLTFTYSSDMTITSYRIHILTDRGGNLTSNGTADCYIAVSIGDITAGKLDAWTQTTNADGSVTVTFDLSTMGHFKNGTELRGLTIVTVTANDTPGTVTYKSIELECEEHDCQVDGHNWSDATCTTPKTCSVCGATEGDANGHSFANGICSVCGVPEFVQHKWDMSDEKDAANWSGYHAMKKNEALTTTVTEAGLQVAYGGTGNGWKGLVLEDTAIDISKLTGKLTFTYSSEMAITKYRIHILTDQGGNLTVKGTADYYVEVKIADITTGSLEAWTQTTNADGSVTVTFDLSTMGHFKNGTELNGLTIVTVTANKVTGTVTYKSIEIR